MTSKKPEKKSADISTTVREILNLSEETGKKAADGIRKEVAKVSEATKKAATAAKAKTEEKKTQETKAAETTPAAEEKKAPAKKPAVRKSTAKKTAAKAASAAKKASTAVKKTAASVKAAAEAKEQDPKVIIQFAGNDYNLEEILKNAKKAYSKKSKKAFKDLRVYIKPEEQKAYFVADDNFGSVDF